MDGLVLFVMLLVFFGIIYSVISNPDNGHGRKGDSSGSSCAGGGCGGSSCGGGGCGGGCGG